MIGQTISHYRIVGKLGIGGMGVVYDAQDQKLARRVALKFLSEELAGDPDATRRLRREAQTIALLNHPHICTIYEVDEHEGRAFIAMERLDGLNLKALMARKKLATAEVLDISVQVAGALEAAHAKGVIHRDIKPGNIVISPLGAVKVLDFGLARLLPTAELSEPAFRRVHDAGPADRHRELHGPGADSANAARFALRSVFPRGRHLRNGDGEATVCRRLPCRDRDQYSRKEPDAVDRAVVRSAGAA